MSWDHASRVEINEVDSSLCHELSRPVLSRPLSYETLVWLLSAVACGDPLTTSQAEVPLEWIHVFYRKWVCSGHYVVAATLQLQINSLPPSEGSGRLKINAMNLRISVFNRKLNSKKKIKSLLLLASFPQPPLRVINRIKPCSSP